MPKSMTICNLLWQPWVLMPNVGELKQVSCGNLEFIGTEIGWSLGLVSSLPPAGVVLSG